MGDILLTDNVREPIPLIAGLQSCPESAQAWIHTYTTEPEEGHMNAHSHLLLQSLYVWCTYIPFCYLYSFAFYMYVEVE